MYVEVCYWPRVRTGSLRRLSNCSLPSFSLNETVRLQSPRYRQAIGWRNTVSFLKRVRSPLEGDMARGMVGRVLSI